MDVALKQRLVGATVIVAAAVIFLPMLLDGPHEGPGSTRALDIPPRPEAAFESRLLPVNPDSGESSINVDQPPVVRHPSPQPEQLSGLETDLPADEQGQAPAQTPANPASNDSASNGNATPAAVSATPDTAGGSESAAAAAPPAVVTPPPQLSGWVVQVGWFSGEDNARSLRDRLRNAGFAAFMEADQVAGKPGFRVRVGPELEKSDANALQERLKQSLGVEGIVMAHP